MRESYCPECRSDELFEQPECLEEHGGDCPDWACVMCGYAIFTGPSPLAVELDGVVVGRVAVGRVA